MLQNFDYVHSMVQDDDWNLQAEALKHEEDKTKFIHIRVKVQWSSSDQSSKIATDFRGIE